MAKSIDKLIINSPYKEPQQHWFYERENRDFLIKEGRRPAGYVMATPNSKAFDDPGVFYEIDLVNKIRPRVKKWRENGYSGVTGITKRLLEYWQDSESGESGAENLDRRFFFCQLEAIETLIWLTEASAAEKTGIEISGDGGAFERWCSKMATGSGKTLIMAMLIAWNFLNKVTNPKDVRFSKNALVVAPGLTVKSRLQVLLPTHAENYYEAFNIVPSSLMDKLRQGKVLIQNWHTLAWDTQEKIDKKVKQGHLRSVDQRKRTEISGEAYVRQVLGEMAKARNILVINDEAHHAWRVNPDAVGKNKRAGSDKDSAEEATIWVGGLDRIHEQRGILRCFDLSATPFSPSGKKSAEESLFSWIVSDFGLNDAIESGLVKTPRVVVRDDSIVTKELKNQGFITFMQMKRSRTTLTVPQKRQCRYRAF
jgi:type III restriction enzyme